MSGTTLTLRPSSDVATADWTLVGAANFAAALSDNSDSSYGQNQSGGAGATLLVQGFPGFALPVLAQVNAVTPRYRFRFATAGPGSDILAGSLLVSDLGGGQHSEALDTDRLAAPLGSGFATASGLSRTSDPAGNPWTVVTLQTIRVQMRSNLVVAYAQCQIAELYLDVYYNQAPVVTLTGPTGTISTTTQPAAAWTYSDPDGDAQERYWVRIYTAAQIAANSLTVTNKALTGNVATLMTLAAHNLSVGATVTVSSVDATFNGTWIVTGTPSPTTFTYARTHADVASTAATGTVFSPDLSATAFSDTGEVYSGARSAGPTVDLPNGSYTAYARAADVGSNGRYGGWSASAFIVALTPPPAPTLTATYDAVNYRNVLTAQAATNLASVNQADVETDASGFLSPVGCTFAQSAAQASNGTHSLAMTSTGTSTMDLATTEPPGAMPVAPSSVYTGYAEFRAAAAARTCRIGIQWYNAAGTWIGTSFGSTAVDSASAWTAFTVTATSPPTAASAALQYEVQTPGSGETHYFDKSGLWPGSGTTWTRGGLSGAAELIVIEFSDDAGVTWTAVRGSPFAVSTYQSAIAYDYELPATVPRTYRARVTSTDSIGNVMTSANSAFTTPLTFSIPRGRWRLVDPITPANSVFIRARMPDEEKTETAAVFRPLGRPDPFEVSSAIDTGWSGTLTFVTLTDAEAAAVDPIISARNSLWLTSPSGVYRLYIRLLSPRKRPRIAAVARQWSAPFIAVRRP